MTKDNQKIFLSFSVFIIFFSAQRTGDNHAYRYKAIAKVEESY